MSINVASQKRPSIVADPFQPGQGGGEANRVDRHAQRHQAPGNDKFRKHEAGGRRSSVAELSAS
jgi:hypothetical protein